MRLSRAESKAANRKALLDAARMLISQDGGSVPIDAIAAAADLTTGAVYSIFGSKRDLLVALITENIARIDQFLGDIDNPSLTLTQAIQGYVDAWLVSYENDTAAENMFELQVLIEAAQDERLLKQLGSSTLKEVERLAGLFANRVIDRDRPDIRTTPEQAREIAQALQAIITGFAVRESLTPHPTDLIRRSCAALVNVLDVG